jgi:hypothetical protein
MNAAILPHPALTGAQLERLCDREGLVIEHLGNAIFRLIQTSAPRVGRIALPEDCRHERRRFDRHSGPEAA